MLLVVMAMMLVCYASVGHFVNWMMLAPASVFAIGNACAVIALSRRPNLTRVRLAALWLVLTGTAAAIALIGIPFWERLLIPPPNEWRDSLPGLGRIILALQILMSVAGAGLGLGWALWAIARLRDRRGTA